MGPKCPPILLSILSINVDILALIPMRDTHYSYTSILLAPNTPTPQYLYIQVLLPPITPKVRSDRM